MKTKEREPMSTADFYHDLFVGGYFHPKDFLEDQWQVRKLNEAIHMIKQYRFELEENNLIEEI